MTVDDRPTVEADEPDAPTGRSSAFDRLERLEPRRTTRWDRPPPPHDWRWVVGMVGKVLIATGILMFGFVAYQLWGTGIEYAQAQDELGGELESLLAPTAGSTVPETSTSTAVEAPPPATALDPAAPTTAAPATTVAAPPVVQSGEALARIEIPDIDVDAVVVEGVSRDDLKRGPGHYPATPLPGQLGNAAIAGHRTTYGAPFKELDELDIGDAIIVTSAQGRFVYEMTAMDIVGPSNGEVISTTDTTVARLTLTTCEPEYSARDRLIVYADLVVEASPAPIPYTPPTVPPSADGAVTPTTVGIAGEEPVVAEVADETADAFAQGWFSDTAAFEQVALWGSLLTFIGVGAYAISWRTRRDWAGALVGVVPFVVVAYFFFQNVNRLLPAAL